MPAATFGPFRLDLETGELERSGALVRLQPQPAKLLVFLVERAGELVSREDIRLSVWGHDTFVDFEQSVNFCIRQVRTALHDNAHSPCYIETLPRRGYRFIAPVRFVSPEESASVQVPSPPPPVRLPSRRVALVGFAGAIAAAVIGTSLSRQFPSAAVRAAAPRIDEQVQLGRFFLKKVSRADTLKALEFFESAAREDPYHAPAFAGIADAYSQLAGNFVAGQAPNDARLRATRAARRAIELDPMLAEPHAVLGSWALRELDWTAADRLLRRAIELDPRNTSARQTYASYLVTQRRFAEAIEQARRAVELEPASLAARHSLAWMLYFSRRYEDAARELRTILDMDRTYTVARRRLGQVLLVAGRSEEALGTLLQASEETQRAPAVLGMLAMAQGRRGHVGEAERIARELEARSVNQTLPSGPMVMAYLGAGNHSRALDWLERVYAERDGFAAYIAVDPLMDPLRDERRYRALCRQVMFGASR